MNLATDDRFHHMPVAQIVLWFVAGWTTVGLAVNLFAYQPEQGGWFWNVLFWPVALIGILTS